MITGIIRPLIFGGEGGDRLTILDFDIPNVSWNINLGNLAQLTLINNTNLNAPTFSGKLVGTFTLFIIQDEIGGRTLTFDSFYYENVG